MILFRVTSHHQLINAIAIKIQFYSNCEADIILSNHTDFSKIIDELKHLNLFRKIYYCDDKVVMAHFLSMPKSQRVEATKKIGNLWNIELDTVYTDYFYGHNIYCNKLFYYYLVEKQGCVTPHSIQEGASSYVVGFSYGNEDDINNKHFGKKALGKAIADFYVYYPECVLFPCKIPLIRFSINNTNVKQAIRCLYNYPILPTEKYIYVATDSEFQGVSSNEIEVIEYISNLVGKDNLVIKRHPRCEIDKYSYRGYKILDGAVAFEAYLLDPNINEKVLISSMSTSLMSAFFMCENTPCILCKEIFIADFSKFIQNNLMNEFLKKITLLYGNQNIFYIRNKEHLKNIIEYLKLKGDLFDE